MNPAPHASRGFTMLELMVVMVVLTMVTAFAMPGLRSSLFTDQLKATARKLVGLVTETGQEAVRSQSEQTLHFDLERNLVWVSSAKKTVKGKDPDSIWDQTPVWDQKPVWDSDATGPPEDTEKRRILTIPDSVKVVDISSVAAGKRATDAMVIRFSTKGYVDKTLIHLRDDEGRDMTLILSPFLAVTKIVDSYVDIDDEKAGY
jgi:prepilin-type N-terminal cleavage/methylation domain-containing protein